MNDDIDRVLDAAFAGFAADTAPAVRPAGLEPVRVTVRRRRNARIAVAAFVAVLAVIVPVAAFAARHDGNNGPPLPAESTAAPTGGPTTAPAGPSFPLPNPADMLLTDPPQHSYIPDCNNPRTTGGEVTEADVCNGSVTLPQPPVDGACLNGLLKFGNGEIIGPATSMTVRRFLQADVTGDGKPETLVVYDCSNSWPGPNFVAVLVRSDGGVRAIAQNDLYAGGGSSRITDLGADASGVWLRIVSLPGGRADAMSVLQWRKYRVQGEAFVQTGGSRAFAYADGGAALENMTLGHERDGQGTFHLVLNVTVRAGRDALPEPTLRVSHHSWWSSSVGGCYALPLESWADGGNADRCRLDPMQPGGTQTLKVLWAERGGVVGPQSGRDNGRVQLRFGDQVVVDVPLPTTVF